MLHGSDATLVTRVISGDAEAFEVLVSRHQRTAHAIARSLGVPASTLDDVVQEAFLKAFRDLGDLRDRARFLPWFLVIVRNCALRSHRKPEASPAHDTRHEQMSVSPADQLEGQELREHLRRKVAELPEGIREAIFIYYYEGRSIAQVAKALETTRAAVKKRLQKGRELLRNELWRELRETLRDMIPSTREWKHRARNLALLAAAVTPAFGTLAVASPTEMPNHFDHVSTVVPQSQGFRRLLTEGGAKMKLTLVASSLILLLAVAIYFAVTDSSSEELSAQVNFVAADPEWYGNMEKRLMDQQVDFFFTKTPLDDAVEQIVNLMGFSIEVTDLGDRDASQLLVNTEISGAPFLDALKVIAAQHALSVRLTPDGVVLTGRPEKYPLPPARSK